MKCALTKNKTRFSTLHSRYYLWLLLLVDVCCCGCSCMGHWNRTSGCCWYNKYILNQLSSPVDRIFDSDPIDFIMVWKVNGQTANWNLESVRNILWFEWPWNRQTNTKDYWCDNLMRVLITSTLLVSTSYELLLLPLQCGNLFLSSNRFIVDL